MKEANAIQFYRGVLKLAPDLLNLPETQLVKRLGDCFKTLFTITPTRDHIRVAIGDFKTNGIKRAWTLKYRYLVKLFLSEPQLSSGQAAKIIKGKFNQRTRSLVIDYARKDAQTTFQNQRDAIDFVQSVDAEYAKKSKDFDLFR